MLHHCLFTPRGRELLARGCAFGLILPPGTLVVASIIDEVFIRQIPFGGDWALSIFLDGVMALFVFALVILEYFVLHLKSRVAALLAGTFSALVAASLATSVTLDIVSCAHARILDWFGFSGISMYFAVLAIGHYQWAALLHARLKHQRGFPIGSDIDPQR